MDQTIPQGGWWSRNWKWFVPVGCLSLLAMCGCCGFGTFFLGLNAVKSSHAYVEAVKRAKEDPDVQKALGTPIETGWMTQFNTNFRNGQTLTDARIPLQGPKGEGTLFVKSTETGAALTFQQLDVVIGHDVIHLAGVEAPKDGPTGPGEGDEVDLDEPGEDKPAEEGGQPDVTVEADTSRSGEDFRDYEMADGDAAKCAMDCASDSKCKAYTFVKPVKEKPGRCRLKGRAASKVHDTCCVSGVKK